MKFDIDRIDFKTFSYDHFVEKYLNEEKPVIIEGVFPFDKDKLTPEYVKNTLVSEGKRSLGWYDFPLLDNDIIQTPEFIKKLFASNNVQTRQNPMRIFMQPGGHSTLPHYDGNSLEGLNLQVTGKKRWVLTSPRTPLPLMPFMFAAMVGEDFVYDEAIHEFCEFETKPGDLLYLPRYWIHEVHSLEKINMNMNWVYTPKKPNISNPIGIREIETMKLRKSFPIINNSFFPDDFTNYGGGGEKIIQDYIKNVSTLRGIKRFFIEVIKYPRLAILSRIMRKRANAFEKNNFNI